MTHSTTYRRPWFSYIQGHKIRYLGYGIMILFVVLTTLGHDLGIWTNVRYGIYDANALGQLYFKNISYETLHAYYMVAFSTVFVLAAYAIVVGIARHKYNNV